MVIFGVFVWNGSALRSMDESISWTVEPFMLYSNTLSVISSQIAWKELGLTSWRIFFQ